MIEIPNDTPRCYPLHGSALPGITGTGITGAGIIGASSHGIVGATSTGSPSHIGRTASKIAGLTSCLIAGAPAGSASSHGNIGIAGSSPSGTSGPSAEPRVDRLTMPASPRIPLSHALEASSTSRPTVRRRSARSHYQQDSRGKTPRQGLPNQQRTTKSHWCHLRSSCTHASQPQASSPY